MIHHLDKYDDLYLAKLKNFISHCITGTPCPNIRYCDSACGLNQFCESLQVAYIDVCQEYLKDLNREISNVRKNMPERLSKISLGRGKSQ